MKVWRTGEPLADQIVRSIEQAAEMYHRLVILAGPAGSGETAALRDVHQRRGSTLVNVNLELSRRLLDLTARQPALRSPRLLSELVNTSESDAILLDNFELLFAVSLKQDPLRLLQGLSSAWKRSVPDSNTAGKTGTTARSSPSPSESPKRFSRKTPSYSCGTIRL